MLPASKENVVGRGERPGNQKEDCGMIEPLHDHATG